MEILSGLGGFEANSDRTGRDAIPGGYITIFMILWWTSMVDLRILTEYEFEVELCEIMLSLQTIETWKVHFYCFDGATGFSTQPE